MVVSTELPHQGIVFWPVGTGDSVTIVIDDEHVLQVDLHDMEMADEEGATVASVVDRLVEVFPEGSEGKPYLAAFVLTHADKDHCLGFSYLLEKVMIGELWATPRLWREYADGGDDELCDDAKAFQVESERRVAATCAAVDKGEKPASGDRIRVIGYDTDHSEHAYSELPDEYLSYPGDAVSMIDGKELGEHFEAFIHAPFKDDCAAERNDTSVALQITLKDEQGNEGHALLFGDLGYETIIKIFDYSEAHARPERLAWDVLLAPHHCSKKVMYVPEDGRDVLKQDVLDAIARHASDTGLIVASSAPFPATNSTGDNPPHIKARNRYEEIVNVICTGEHPDEDAPEPVVFTLDEGGLTLLSSTETLAKSAETIAASTGARLAAAGLLAGIVAAAVSAVRRGKRATTERRGLDGVREAVATARGDDAAPQQAIGFGSR